MTTEIPKGTKKLYVIDVEDSIVILVDCEATGGMVKIPMTRGQFLRWQGVREETIQEIFPELRAELRETLISGLTPAEWSEVFCSEPHTKEQLIKEFNYVFED